MRIFLHIGLEHVGADRIQAVLADKRNQLREEGILYAHSAGARNHTRFFMAVTDANHIDPLRFNRGFMPRVKQNKLRNSLAQDLAKEVDKHKPETLILSATQFGTKLYRESEIRRVYDLLKPLSKDIRLVAHVDEQSKLLARHYAHQVMEGRAAPLSRDLDLVDAEDWTEACRDEMPVIAPLAAQFEETQGPPVWLDFAAVQSRWEAVFGEGSLTFRPYDQELFNSESVTKEVRAAFDIKPKLGKHKPMKTRKEPSDQWLARGRQLNELMLRFLSHSEQIVPRKLWLNLIAELRTEGEPVNPASLSRISKRFEKSNKALVKAHPALSSELFDRPRARKEWEEPFAGNGYRASQYLLAAVHRIDKANQKAKRDMARDLMEYEIEVKAGEQPDDEAMPPAVIQKDDPSKKKDLKPPRPTIPLPAPPKPIMAKPEPKPEKKKKKKKKKVEAELTLKSIKLPPAPQAKGVSEYEPEDGSESTSPAPEAAEVVTPTETPAAATPSKNELSKEAREIFTPLAVEKFEELIGSPFAPHNKIGKVNEEELGTAYAPMAKRELKKGSSGNVIVGCMKNEAPYIVEWVAYHRSIGVDNFLIYTNDCSDGTSEILDRLQEMGVLEHRNNDNWKGNSPQQYALNQSLKEPVIKNADWIIHIDVDEFMNVRCGNGTLDDFFAHVPDATNVAMTWRLFGHGGVTKLQENLIIDQFEGCAPKFCPKPHTAWGFKTMFKNIGAYEKISCHRPNKLDEDFADKVKWVNGSGRDMTKEASEKGWRSSKKSIGYDLLQLNHYALRSAESYLIKRQRGRALHVDRSIGLNYWIRMDWNDFRDVTIKRNVPRVREEYDRLMQDDTLREWHQKGFAWHQAKAEELHNLEEYEELYHQALKLKLNETERVAYALSLDLES